MKSGKLFFGAIFLCLASFTATRAQEAHQHDHQHDAAEKLGQVHFHISCGAKSQQQFTRALALLHSFQYVEAEQAFVEISVSEPQCAMAEWGAAMTNYHPLWTPPTPAELKKGWAAVEKAKA